MTYSDKVQRKLTKSYERSAPHPVELGVVYKLDHRGNLDYGIPFCYTCMEVVEMRMSGKWHHNEG